jgi:zinc transporter
VDIRSKAISLRRYIAPQRDVLIHILGTNLGWIKQSHQRALHESYDIITRHLEDLESVRERSILVKDELSNMLNEKLNKNMYVLSVISAIFLPLTFLTGLLGINVAGIPGAENPQAFGIFCTLLFGLVVAQYFIFKKLKWFL